MAQFIGHENIAKKKSPISCCCLIVIATIFGEAFVVFHILSAPVFEHSLSELFLLNHELEFPQ